MQVHVVHPIHSSKRVTLLKTRAPAYANASQFAVISLHLNKTLVAERLPIFIPAQLQMNVGNDADPDTFVERREAPAAEWTDNLFRVHCAHRVAIGSKDVKSTVEMIATVGRVETAAHFANCRNYFVRTLLRVQWP